MFGIFGKIAINVAFLLAVLSAVFYYLSSKKDDDRAYKIANYFFGFKTLFVTIASGILLYLIINHQFQYFYVFNYSSLDLQMHYLFSSFYGGQEGSFLFWILCSGVLGLGLLKWTRKPYRAPVMFFMVFTQIFLLSMILGWDFAAIKLGASPFRTIAEEMPNAPFLQANPNFIPVDGKGLNDLLKSPWMMIHPPMLFLGFAMMTIPFAFAMAALWKGKYVEWIKPALPWTLASNVFLLTAIFLGGYWAYVTLSFGGYWAWDPVENASLVPWLIGSAGIHAMIIQRKKGVAAKSSILFAILAYLSIVYETFLTRSGILSDSSVHSFVDLGLFNQLLVFMLVIALISVGFYVYRLKEFPSPASAKKSDKISGDKMTLIGALLLFTLGFVILTGTSSPILGKLFVSNPTPPDISFYNNWSMPIVMIMAVMMVIGQFTFWRKYNVDSLSSALILPVIGGAIFTMASVMMGKIYNFYYIIYIFTAWFSLVGNSLVFYDLAKKNPKYVGGTLTHIGFAILLLGIIASSAFTEVLIDQRVKDYNKRVAAGEVVDENGVPVTEPVNFLELNIDSPKIVGDQFKVTYEGYDLSKGDRPGQQAYRVKFEPANGDGQVFYVHPVVYPMRTGPNAPSIQWSVDPDVHTGWFSDYFVYVAGSSYVERRNNLFEKNRQNQVMMNTSSIQQDEVPHDHDGDGVADHAVNDHSDTETTETTEKMIRFSKGDQISAGGYSFTFNHFTQPDNSELPEGTIVGVRAEVTILHEASNVSRTITPLYALVEKDGSNLIFSPKMQIIDWGIDVSFHEVDPKTDEIVLKVEGIDADFEKDWILLVAEKKPFISVVWLGTFLLMGGFSVSIFRRWAEEKKHSEAKVA